MGLPFRQRSLSQLLRIIAASSALTTLGFAAASSLPRHAVHGQRLALSLKLPCLTAMLVGLGGNILGQLALGRGIKRHRWSEETLTFLLARLSRPIYTALGSLCLIGLVVVAIASPFGHATTSFMAFFVPFQTLTTLRTTLRKGKRPERSKSRDILTHAKPLQSDHWGAPSYPAPK